MADDTVVELSEMRIMYVRAENGVKDAAKAFDQLEDALPKKEDGSPNLRGRRFYGIFHSDREYWACVVRNAEDDPQMLQLQEGTISGGKYAMRKMLDWQKRIPEIADTADDLLAKHPADQSRPQLEFYRSEKELILFQPILE